MESVERFVDAMGHAATAVSVVTTNGVAGKFGMTVSAFSSVSATPPLVLACVNRKSPVADAISRNTNFCINALADHQSMISDTFAGRPPSGAPYDFDCADWDVARSGSPVLADALAAFDCALDSASDAGTHRIFIGRVLEARHQSMSPLVYAQRQYRQVTELKTAA